jgi:hypothetical protein
MMGRGENMKFTTKLIYYILILIPLYFIFKDNASIDMIKDEEIIKGWRS